MTDLAQLTDIAAFEAYLAQQEAKSLLRFLTCGSVDDGKSTLIGRLLYDTKLLFDDQLATLEKDSRRHGTDGDNIDFALLVDGLEAEREQGITIDVAYRFFATDKRKFIVADTPGHEQYTRNMATGASTADLAVLLIDARQGVLVQTRRHAFIAHLLGIRQLVLAINKIDLVDFSQARFNSIVAEFAEVAKQFAFEHIQPIPMSARYGDNVTTKSARTPWYRGPALLDHLETVPVGGHDLAGPFRFPVQRANRPNQDFRGFQGTIASGIVRPRDPVIVATSGRATRIARVVTADGDQTAAHAGEAVTLTLENEVDISRGDLLCAPDDRAEVSDQFAADLIWMADEPLLPGRGYLMKIGARTVGAQVTDLKYQVDVNSFEHIATKQLELNGVAVVNLATSAPIAFDPYTQNHHTGAFILIDRQSNATMGAGMLQFGLRRATNIHHQAVDVDQAARAALLAQTPKLLWFTGLSGAGKSTIANLVEKRLHAEGRLTYLLDGDNVRAGLNRDLGFTDADRVENIRRVGEVAKLMVDAGLIVMTAFISPFRAERRMVRDLFPEGAFLEVHVDVPLAAAEARDVKGLYKKARAGQIANFTGIDSPYEAPEHAEIHIDTTAMSAEDAADLIVRRLRAAEGRAWTPTI